MNQVYRLVAKEFRLFWSDRVAVSLTFIVPVVLTVIFGAVFGGMGGGPNGIRLAIVNQSSSELAKKIESELDTMKAIRLIRTFKDETGKEIKFDSINVKNFVKRGSASAALILPADMYTDTSLGLKVKLFFDPKNDIEIQMLQGIIQRTMFQQMPDIFTQTMQRQSERVLGADSGKLFNQGMASLVGKYFNIDTSWILNPSMSWQQNNVPDSVKEKSNFFAKAVQIEERQLVGEKIVSPWATRSVGGWAMMFLLFSLTGSATSLFDEKKTGVVLRLLASPISRTHILWSKYIFNMFLGMMQLMFLFIVGWLLFKIDIFSNLFNLILIVMAASIACTAFGMLLASFCRTPQQANGWGTLLILTMSSIGGAWFPISFMPEYIQFFSKFTIIYWSMDGFLQVLWRGVGTVAILPNIGILLGIATLINIVSVIQFKKGHVF